MTRRQFLRILASAGVFLLCSAAALTDEVRHLKLSEAVRLAIEQNRALKIARFKVQENEHRKEGARLRLFSVITNQSNALISANCKPLDSPGAFGTANSAPIPTSIRRCHRQEDLISSGTMIAQPLTQLCVSTRKSHRGCGGRQSRSLRNSEMDSRLATSAAAMRFLVDTQQLRRGWAIIVPLEMKVFLPCGSVVLTLGMGAPCGSPKGSRRNREVLQFADMERVGLICYDWK